MSIDVFTGDVLESLLSFDANNIFGADALSSFAINVSASIASAFIMIGMAEGMRRWESWRAAREATKNAEFDKSISSADLIYLGGYLHNTLGSVSIEEYTRSKDMSGKIDRYLSRVYDYVSLGDSDLGSGANQEASPPTGGLMAGEVIPVGLRGAWDEIAKGEAWNGLARLRRDLEIRLAAMGGSKSEEFRRQGVYQMARNLLKAGLITTDVGDLIRNIVEPANRAIHGLEVSTEEAEAALGAAVELYALMGWDN